MQFDLNKSITILQRTPAVLKQLLEGLDEDWIMNNEGPETWSPFKLSVIYCMELSQMDRAYLKLMLKR